MFFRNTKTFESIFYSIMKLATFECFDNLLFSRKIWFIFWNCIIWLNKTNSINLSQISLINMWLLAPISFSTEWTFIANSSFSSLFIFFHHLIPKITLFVLFLFLPQFLSFWNYCIVPCIAPAFQLNYLLQPLNLLFYKQLLSQTLYERHLFSKLSC